MEIPEAPDRLSWDSSRFWEISGCKIRALEAAWDETRGAPVITVEGRWTNRAWTEWTQGFRVGSAFLQFEATGDEQFLELGRRGTRQRMAPLLAHTGIHDHGFQQVSTWGTWRRLILEGRLEDSGGELELCEQALRVSGATQARRWTPLPDEEGRRDRCGFLYSFHGPHSLFIDTMRSLRSLELAWLLGQPLLEEGDRRVDLLLRALEHARTTARYALFYGEGRDVWDRPPGRVAHESLFDPVDGSWRCPATQQGWSPFTTWTRGLAWALLGFAECLEFLAVTDDASLEAAGGRAELEAWLLRAARTCAGIWLAQTPADGIPYWDTGAPGLAALGDWRSRPADPENGHEPVDSSAAAIAAQGFLRLGRWLGHHGEAGEGERWFLAGQALLRTLLEPPWLIEEEEHQGLLRHALYHRPRGWDHVPAGSTIPRGEACQWGDYHLREAVLWMDRRMRGETTPRFFGPVPAPQGAAAGRGPLGDGEEGGSRT